MKLKDKKILQTGALIGGKWLSNKSTFNVSNPATGKAIAKVTDAGAKETTAAIQAAEHAFTTWKETTVYARAELLNTWADLIERHADDLAMIMTCENGKPLAESKGEVAGGVQSIRWSAEEGKRTYGATWPHAEAGKRFMTIKQPVGVVAAITPWNFPHSMITRKVAPALAAGCTVVLKPADLTPLSALALGELANRAGIPAGVFNIVPTSDAKTVGEALTSSPIVRKLSFTGSTQVGKLLMHQCANTVKKLTLELGGNAPMVVFDDADLDSALTGLLECKTRNAGQACNSINRLYVHTDVYDAFCSKVVAALTSFKVGNGAKKGVHIGPLINQAGFDKVNELVQDALNKGATALLGAQPHKLGGTFYQPTVLRDVTQAMDIAHNEIFGPVVTLIPFSTEQEAIANANDTPYGLAAYFYTENMSRAWHVAEALEAGMVGINTTRLSRADVPFGGMKESGLGRLGSFYGVEEYLEVKSVAFGV